MKGEIRTDEVRRVLIPVVPFRCQPTDVEGDPSQATCEVTHKEGATRTIRSRYVDADIPPVPLGQEALIEALTAQVTVGSDAAGGVPTLTLDVIEHTPGGVPGVELDVDLHVSGNQLAQLFQNLSCQTILADEVQTLLWWAVTIDSTYGPFAQVGSKDEGEGPVASRDVAGQIGPCVLVAMPLLLTVRVIVVSVHPLKTMGSGILDS